MPICNRNSTYLNGHFLGCLGHWPRDAVCLGRETDLDRPNAWMGQPEHAARAIAYLESNLITLLEQYPETQFQLVFPPYSRAKFAIWHQYRLGDAEAHLAVIRYLAELGGRLPNLHLFGYEDQDFLDDIARFKDMDHFDPGINSVLNSVLTRSIGQSQNRPTGMNVENYIAACIEPRTGATP